MKLWQKGRSTDKLTESFTVGDDYILDKRLLPYDCKASCAHAVMLASIGLLTKKESDSLCAALNHIRDLNEKGDFHISISDEDCHTAIENYLVAKLGETGKKIHTGRSRNDQVLTALRLYYLDAVKAIRTSVKYLISTLEIIIEKSGSVPMPGYTHTRKAMPTNTGTWIGCFRDSLSDNLTLLDAVETLLDQSPLGSAAGYGCSLDLNKSYSAKLMGFSRVQENPIYTQHSRVKFDADLVHCCSQILFDLNRLSSDIILFSEPQFNYISLPDKFTTGSSIMPQKKNPDIFELIRGNYHLVLGHEMQIKSLGSNLITGYHRDFQLLKKSVFSSLDSCLSSLEICTHVMRDLKINANSCRRAMSQELYATEKVYDHVRKGVSFREAYRLVKNELYPNKEK